MSVKAHALYDKHAIPQQPQIAYSQAMSSCFVLGNTTHRVSTCPVSALQHLIRSALPDSNQGKVRNRQKREELQALLRMLDTDTSDLSRWYTVETLLVLGVTIPFVEHAVRDHVAYNGCS